jgi:quinol monooxygenase YgiN
MILITAKASVLPEDRDAYNALAREQVKNSRREPGCLDYGYYEDAMQPGIFIFVEKWNDQEALDFHFAQDYCLDFIKGVRKLAKPLSDIEINDISRVRTPREL